MAGDLLDVTLPSQQMLRECERRVWLVSKRDRADWTKSATARRRVIGTFARRQPHAARSVSDLAK